MENANYALILTGGLMPGFDAATAWPALATYFRIEQERLHARVLPRAPLAIKQSPDADKLRRLEGEIQAIGAEAQVLKLDDRPNLFVLSSNEVHGPLPHAYIEDCIRRGIWASSALEAAEVGSNEWKPWAAVETSADAGMAPVPTGDAAPVQPISPAQPQLQPEPPEKPKPVRSDVEAPHHVDGSEAAAAAPIKAPATEQPARPPRDETFAAPKPDKPERTAPAEHPRSRPSESLVEPKSNSATPPSEVSREAAAVVPPSPSIAKVSAPSAAAAPTLEMEALSVATEATREPSVDEWASMGGVDHWRNAAATADDQSAANAPPAKVRAAEARTPYIAHDDGAENRGREQEAPAEKFADMPTVFDQTFRPPSRVAAAADKTKAEGFWQRAGRTVKGWLHRS
ncbi:MAG: hypothetical protein WBV61_11070 [Rhodanobacteraceae bacterium]